MNIETKTKHYYTRELIVLRDRCYDEAKRLKKDYDSQPDAELDMVIYNLLWMDTYGDEESNEFTTYCAKATHEEIFSEAGRIINIEIQRRLDEIRRKMGKHINN
jgi:hypothetical protein